MNDRNKFELVNADTGELVQSTGPLSPRELVLALESYKGLQAELDKALPEALVHIQSGSGSHTFRTKAYWRAIARAFRLRVELVEERREETGDGFTYLATYRASTPDGDSMTGDGAASSAEKRPGQATVHNVRSHAHTRAKNRAISDLVGFGEVTAEEVELQPARAREPASAPAEPTTTGAGLPALITDKQFNLIKIRCAKNGISSEELCQQFLVKSVRSLKMDQVDAVLEWIEASPSKKA